MQRMVAQRMVLHSRCPPLTTGAAARGANHGERVVCEACHADAVPWALHHPLHSATLAGVDAEPVVLTRAEHEFPVLGEVERVDARRVLSEHAADADVLHAEARRRRWCYVLYRVAERRCERRDGGAESSDGGSPAASTPC
eukprot:scaffold31794_cov107-Isochrysis_galbana.AAC.11